MDGSTACPSYANPLTPEQQTKVNKWVKDKQIAKHLLAQKIPDLTILQVQKKTTVAEMWAEITEECIEKGVYTQTALHTQFLESKLAKGADVQQFLDRL